MSEDTLKDPVVRELVALHIRVNQLEAIIANTKVKAPKNPPPSVYGVYSYAEGWRDAVRALRKAMKEKMEDRSPMLVLPCCHCGKGIGEHKSGTHQCPSPTSKGSFLKAVHSYKQAKFPTTI